jgi:uncharacterized protein (TIGR02145 family)
MPQLTTDQRNELSDAYGSEAEFKGLMIYNTDNNCMEYWNGTKWISQCGSSASASSDPFMDEGIVIDGIKWATRNVATPGKFTAKPEDAGKFYQWGSKVGWSSADPLSATDGDNTWRDLYEIDDVWLPENDPCPTGWRVPTKEELIDLISSADSWGNLNGVDGYYFGTVEPKLFLPAAGRRYYSTGSLYVGGSSGYYWSSTQYSATNAYYLYFSSSSIYASDYNNKYGLSIRCVAEL